MPFEFKVAILCLVLTYYALVGLKWLVERALNLLVRAFFCVVQAVLNWMCSAVVITAKLGFQLVGCLLFQTYLLLRATPSLAKRFCHGTLRLTENTVTPSGVSVYHGGRHMIRCAKFKSQVATTKTCKWFHQTACPFLMLLSSLGCATIVCAWRSVRFTGHYIKHKFQVAARRACGWCKDTGIPFLKFLALLTCAAGVLTWRSVRFMMRSAKHKTYEAACIACAWCNRKVFPFFMFLALLVCVAFVFVWRFCKHRVWPVTKGFAFYLRMWVLCIDTHKPVQEQKPNVVHYHHVQLQQNLNHRQQKREHQQRQERKQQQQEKEQRQPLPPRVTTRKPRAPLYKRGQTVFYWKRQVVVKILDVHPDPYCEETYYSVREVGSMGESQTEEHYLAPVKIRPAKFQKGKLLVIYDKARGRDVLARVMQAYTCHLGGEPWYDMKYEEGGKHRQTVESKLSLP
eukprot:scaffold4884_cov165-Amphora_coffeaeformis.AAC.15